MTKGEGTKYCYYMIRKNMHESHLFPLPEVVGPVSNPPAKKLEFCFMDMPCQIPPALRNVDIDAADSPTFCLGEVRPAAPCLPSYMHYCPN